MFGSRNDWSRRWCFHVGKHTRCYISEAKARQTISLRLNVFHLDEQMNSCNLPFHLVERLRSYVPMYPSPLDFLWWIVFFSPASSYIAWARGSMANLTTLLYWLWTRRSSFYPFHHASIILSYIRFHFDVSSHLTNSFRLRIIYIRVLYIIGKVGLI